MQGNKRKQREALGVDLGASRCSQAGQEAATAALESPSHPDQPGPSLGTVAKPPQSHPGI